MLISIIPNLPISTLDMLVADSQFNVPVGNVNFEPVHKESYQAAKRNMFKSLYGC